MLYLYGITEPLRSAQMPRGLDGAEVLTLAVEDLAAAYSSHQNLSPSPGPGSYLAHEHVLEALMELGTVLPARFGTTFADPAGLVQAVRQSAPALREQLSRVRGCVEVAVRVAAGSRPEPLAPSNGRSYLLGRLAQQVQDQEMLEGVLGGLRERAVATRLAAATSKTSTLKVSYLVRSSEVEAFSAELGRLQRERPELALSATGPWPPFSFAEEAVA